MVIINHDLEKSLDFLLRYLSNVKKDETLLICGDKGSDENVLDAAVSVGEKLGAFTTLNFCKHLRDFKKEPHRKLAISMLNADVICDFSERYLFRTLSWKKALSNGTRGYCLGNLTSDAIMRCIDEKYSKKIMNFGYELYNRTRKANVITISSKQGTNITIGMGLIKSRWEIFFKIFRTMRLSWVGEPTGICHNPGQNTFLIGQVSFNGIKRSINGTLVFDGSIWPPFELGLISSPIFCKIKNGRIVNIKGGRDADIFNRWLKKTGNNSVSEIEHFSYGFNPGAILSGCIFEDERVPGSITVGIGKYPMHADCVMIKPTIKIDDDFIEEDGGYRCSSFRETLGH